MDLLAAIRDHADALTDSRHHSEPRWGWDANRHRKPLDPYVTVQPGLLAQLAEMAPHPQQGDGGSRRKPSSKPPGNFEALAMHTAVTIGVVRWCHELRVELRATVEDSVRALVGVAPVLGSDTLGDLAAELGRWRRKADILCGWRTPPLTLVEPCPLCRQRSVLRINADGDSAYCSTATCDATWEGAAIHELFTHLRTCRERSAADADLARLRARAQRLQEVTRRSPAA